MLVWKQKLSCVITIKGERTDYENKRKILSLCGKRAADTESKPFFVTEYLIFYAFILFMLWASRAKGVRSLGFAAFVSVIAVVSGGALLIGWKRRPESERLRYLALIGLYLVSFFMTFAYTESFIRFLGLAPFIGCILFFDPKYSRIGGIGYLVLNALTVFGQIRQQPEGVAGTTNLVLDLLARSQTQVLRLRRDGRKVRKNG